MLIIEKVSKFFGDIHAVSNLSFEVGRGEVFGLLGPNGAGKTTTLRMIIGLLKPDSGRIQVGSHGTAEELRNRIGYLPEERGLYARSTVKEVLLYLASLKNTPRAIAEPRLTFWLERLSVTDGMHRRVEQLSKGNQQKIQFIAALLHEPDVIVVDEPFAGLDPINQVLVRDVLAELGANGRTVLLSAHQMDHIERMCPRICMIHHGRIVAYDSVENLKKRFDNGRIRLYANSPELDKIMATGILGSAERRGDCVEGLPAGGQSFSQVLRRVGEAIDVIRIEQIRPSLEDIFVRLAPQDRTDEATSHPGALR